MRGFAASMGVMTNRYVVLEKLGEGGMGAVFRARDRLTGEQVALKRVAVGAPRLPGLEPTQPATASALDTALAATSAAPVATVEAAPPAAMLLALAQEFRALASIRPPHVISVLDYGFEPGDAPFFTMELLEGVSRFDEVARQCTLERRVSLLMQVLQALLYVHRRGVLHRDLKPANIAVLERAGGPHVKVLDFGVACVRDQAHRAALAGTIAYMAPELLADHRPTQASDLFSVGVIAHEVLLGAHPISATDVPSFMTALLGKTPLVRRDDRLGPGLWAVLERALSREPAERYGDAAEMCRDLARAAGVEPPTETAEIRESFLQAATFVGRDDELATLQTSLHAAMAGQGAAVLIGGESGVGKSRLVDELRTLSLVRGATVVRGQAVREGGSSYQVWRGALRALCLEPSLDDATAGVLLAAVPDVAALLGRPVSEAPEVDAQDAQLRFVFAATSVLLGHQGALVVLLEDLQWADPASLFLLEHVTRQMAGSRVLLLGTFRSDEAAPVEQAVPSAQRLYLKRLSSEAVTNLCRSMLGERGAQPAVLSLVERETEGNAFFVVEVVRAMANEAGALAEVGAAGIPDKVIAGGVDAVLTSRLERVEREARAVLTAAAIMGRELELAALVEVAGATRVERGLRACAAVAVLEVQDNRWRFAHDKLREAVLAGLSPGERASLHLAVAEGIERAHAADLGPWSAALAFHLEQAGEPRRSARHGVTAGERALHAGAARDAVALLDRALGQLERTGASRGERMKARSLLCRSLHAAGEVERCAQELERLMGALGFEKPAGPRSLAGALCRRALRHGRSFVGASAPGRVDADEARLVRDVLDTHTAVAEAIPWVRSPAEAVAITLASAVMAQELGDATRSAPQLAAVGALLSGSPLSRVTDAHIARARALQRASPETSDATQAHLEMMVAFVHLQRCEWGAQRASLERELLLRQRMGAYRHELFARLQLAACDHFSGQAEQVLRQGIEIERLARRAENHTFVAWARAMQTAALLRKGQLGQAGEQLAAFFAERGRGADPVIDLVMGTCAALWAWRTGDRDLARRRADETLEQLLTTSNMGYGQIDGHEGLCELYANMAEAGDGRALDQLARCLSSLRAFASMFTFARARTLRWHGHYLALKGFSRLARPLLERASSMAAAHGLRFDEGFARWHLSQLLARGGDDAGAAAQREQATSCFERVGAVWYAGAATRSR